MKKTAIFALSLMAAGCFHDAEKKEAAEAASDSGAIVAEVNGVQISETRISAYAPAAGQDRAAIIENIIAGEVIEQAARDAGMHLLPGVAEQMRIAEQTVLGRAYTRDFIDNHPITEATVSLRFEEFKSEFAGRDEYRTAHILVEDEALAKDLRAQLAADGGKFAELARKHSIDPGSAAQGGELGWTDPRALVPEYAAAMEQLAPGEIAAAPVRTPFGWHIIRVDEKRPLTPPQMNDELRHNIEQSARAELFSAHLQELRAAASIVIK